MPLLVTPRGSRLLAQRLTVLKDGLKQIQGGKGEAAEVGGNQWHDNFAFEQLSREEDAKNSEIRRLMEVIKGIIVVEAPKGTDRLQIGHIVHLEAEDGTKATYLVGGYEETDLGASPPVVAYLAPLIAPFMGHEVGYETRVRMGGKVQLVSIDRIEMAPWEG